MRRIAYLSPLNPAPSGISDYSEELLPYLAQYAEITLYVSDELRPNNPALTRHLELRPISRLERDQRRQRYDAIVYHMGNSPVHAAIWQIMQRIPGVVVLHEFVLHHFMLNYAATVCRSVESYYAEVARRYGTIGERVAQLMLHGRFTPAAFELPLCESVLEQAEGVIAHSRYVIDHVAALRPELPSTLVPMGVPLPPTIDRAQARQRRGLSPDALILASFGHINPYKRLDIIVRTLQQLRTEQPNLHYLLVGSISPSYDARAVVARAGLEDCVSITGYTDRAAFEDYVAAADICLNLRHPTAGETSASLLRLLGAGRPTLVTASGSFTELPPGVAAQVDMDRGERDLILAYCRLLTSQPTIAAALGANARAYVAQSHTLDDAAKGYMDFLANLYSWEPPQKKRNQPLWNPSSPDIPPTTNNPPKTTTARDSATHQVSTTEASAPSPLTSAVVAALSQIGIHDHDHTLLHTAAQAIADLFHE